MKTRESEVQDHPWPESIFATRMEYVKPCLKRKKNLAKHGTSRQDDQGHAQLHSKSELEANLGYLRPCF